MNDWFGMSDYAAALYPEVTCQVTKRKIIVDFPCVHALEFLQWCSLLKVWQPTGPDCQGGGNTDNNDSQV